MGALVEADLAEAVTLRTLLILDKLVRIVAVNLLLRNKLSLIAARWALLIDLIY